MATLINQDKYTLIVGDDVDSSYESEQEAEKAARLERARGRIAQVVPPGEPFCGTGWSGIDGVERV